MLEIWALVRLMIELPLIQVTYSCGPSHMDEQRQDDQQEPTYNSSVPIQDVALMDDDREGRWWRDMMMMMIYIY